MVGHVRLNNIDVHYVVLSNCGFYRSTVPRHASSWMASKHGSRESKGSNWMNRERHYSIVPKLPSPNCKALNQGHAIVVVSATALIPPQAAAAAAVGHVRH
jgi:hypothetical protein